eukprot:6279161-Pyramimonas_sp.AAC.1
MQCLSNGTVDLDNTAISATTKKGAARPSCKVEAGSGRAPQCFTCLRDVRVHPGEATLEYSACVGRLAVSVFSQDVLMSQVGPHGRRSADSPLRGHMLGGK